jgi:tetratricopeptide (TPR) repeat protein
MYMKKNKLRLAEYHYQRALDINPYNAVILGCMGMVSLFRHFRRSIQSVVIADFNFSPGRQAVQRRGDNASAMSFFNDAIRLVPDNALVRYHRAKLYISMRQYKVCPTLIAPPTPSLPHFADASWRAFAFVWRVQPAVADLERLRDTTPGQPLSSYFLLRSTDASVVRI